MYVFVSVHHLRHVKLHWTLKLPHTFYESTISIQYPVKTPVIAHNWDPQSPAAISPPLIDAGEKLLLMGRHYVRPLLLLMKALYWRTVTNYSQHVQIMIRDLNVKVPSALK